MVNYYKILEWDSNFFKYKIADITANKLDKNHLKKILVELRTLNVKLVYWKIDPNDEISNSSAILNLGILADKKVTYKIDLDRTDTYSIHPNIQSIKGNNVDNELIELVLQSGEYSRYKIDKSFKNNEYENLYRKWIERSLNGEVAEDVLVYFINNIKAGFITYGIKNKIGDIGLLAVNHEYRGQKIGQNLMVAAFNKIINLGINTVQVVTQLDNIAANKFYTKIGFNIVKIEYIYHFWL